MVRTDLLHRHRRGVTIPWRLSPTASQIPIAIRTRIRSTRIAEPAGEFEEQRLTEMRLGLAAIEFCIRSDLDRWPGRLVSRAHIHESHGGQNWALAQALRGNFASISGER